MDKHRKGTTNLLITTVLIAFVLYLSYNNKASNPEIFDTKVHNEINLISVNEAILSMASTTSTKINDSTSDLNSIEELAMEKEEIKAEENRLDEHIEVSKKAVTEKQEVEKKPEEVVEVKTPPAKKEITETASRGSSIGDSRTQNDTNLSGYLNGYVLEVIKTYKIGDYPYLLNADYQNYNGVTENLYYQGELLLKANPNGNKASHCTGITFEVFFKAMQKRNKDLGIAIDDFNGMSKDDLMNFALTWYVATGPKSESNLAVAIEKYGIGKRIKSLEELRPGDFIDFSRENNTGHSVIFINWIKEGNKIIGFKYWSSQGSTKGISYKEEYLNIKKSDGSKYGNVIADGLYMARVYPVKGYNSFK